MNHADSVRIETDEGRIVMIVEHDDGTDTYDIHAIALEVEAEMRRELGPWAQEAALARRTMPDSLEDGYDRGDPKHPDWHDTLAGIYDSREGK